MTFFIMLMLLSSASLAAGLGGAVQVQQDVSGLIAGGSVEDLSDTDVSGLLFMREEEKLAHDVYITLYDQWGLQIFSNIASSEQTHTDGVAAVMAACVIDDPV
ncbi:MAG: DUF2202 domain-containing protein, partial [Nanoarchaeota archaeon]|nr:DUF2202 domain-containing protein [Nanoarchaeota archaeon]